MQHVLSLSIYLSIYLPTYLSIYIIYIYICVYIYIYVYAYVYINKYVCVYICLYIYVLYMNILKLNELIKIIISIINVFYFCRPMLEEMIKLSQKVYDVINWLKKNLKTDFV